MKCFKCGSDNPESNQFCSDCGAELEEMNCQNCENPLTTDMKFCGKCGTENPIYEEPTLEPQKNQNRKLHLRNQRNQLNSFHF